MSSSSESDKPIITSALGFSAKIIDGKVQTSWKSIKNITTAGFKYYKVVRSSEKENPVYPDDWYIHYTEKDLSYTDENPKEGKNYYRVCAIMESGKRYCSNVVKMITSEKSNDSYIKETEEQKPEKKEMKPEPRKDMKQGLRMRVENVVRNFSKQLDKAYGDDNLKKITKMQEILTKLQEIQKNNPSEVINTFVESMQAIINEATIIPLEIQSLFQLK